MAKPILIACLVAMIGSAHPLPAALKQAASSSVYRE